MNFGTNLETMRNMDVRIVDPAGLREIDNVTIRTDLPREERIKDYIEQIGNPYCYRHGKYVVKVSFANSGKSLEECLLSYLRSKC